MKPSNKTCYLLLYLGAMGSAGKEYPRNPVRKPNKILLKRTKELADFLKINIWISPLFGKFHSHDNNRLFFRFKRYLPNDELAQKIAESILFSVHFLYPLGWSRDGETLFFSFPREKIKNKNKIVGEIIIEDDKKNPSWNRQLIFPEVRIRNAVFIEDDRLAEGLRISKIPFMNKNILQALSFFYHSQNDFFIDSEDIPEAIENENTHAQNSFEQNRWENSLQNSFKAIESIIGDPPKDDAKFFAKLKKAGIDPYCKVGCEDGKPIFEAIRRMNTLRDKKAAHGSTPKRNIKLIEMINIQYCTKTTICLTIEHLLGDKINF